MSRKWNCERNARGPRGPPRQFPAVCPCEAVCAGLRRRVASLPLPAPETALSRPVWQVCGGSRKSAAPPGRGKNGGRKRCRKKQWCLWAASANHTVPQCGAGRRFPRVYREIWNNFVLPRWHHFCGGGMRFGMDKAGSARGAKKSAGITGGMTDVFLPIMKQSAYCRLFL